ncbi:unnamed protein product [Trichogramma brassicae]|uniref:Protein TsetseEP domain-containing protein n=1 Tax=Trichogramma brassicae TaxID=86971 RepID=A0A6H5IFL7_9HYME|nr:unnamed protein product [Trichogramma brassicae]
MKAFAFFAVCAFVCGAQAGVVQQDDDVVTRSSLLQTQLKVFIDYVDASLKPALYKTLEESSELTKKVANASEEVTEANNKFIYEIVEIVRQNERIYEAAKGIDVQECGVKTIDMSKRVAEAVEAANKCVVEKAADFEKKPVEVREKINEIVKLIDGNTLMAKKCVDEHTFLTSLTTAACLTRAKVSSDAAWASAPGNLKIVSLNMELDNLVKDMKACAAPKVFDGLRAEARQLTAEAKDCIYEKVLEQVKVSEQVTVPEVEEMKPVEGVEEVLKPQVE